MTWLNRNIKVLGSFPPQKREVNTCSMWSGYSVFGFTDNQPCWCDKHEWHIHHMRQKNYVSHTITHVHNIGHGNCSTYTYFFPKQTDIHNRVVTQTSQMSKWYFRYFSKDSKSKLKQVIKCKFKMSMMSIYVRS